MTDATVTFKRAMRTFGKAWKVKEPPGFDPNSAGLGDSARVFLRRLSEAKAPVPPPTFGERLVAHALKDVGVVEHPAGSNSGPRIDAALRFAGIPLSWPADRRSWCAAMVSLWLHEIGYDYPWPSGKASVASWEAMAAGHGFYVPSSQAKAGDLVTFQFDSDPEGDHIGVVRGRPSGGMLPTVEGNTSRDDRGSQSNGGGVFARLRPLAVVHHVIRLR